MTEGTPKTLIEAINNALAANPVPSPHGVDVVIQAHVRDFLAQRFSVAILDADGSHNCEGVVADLWEKITGERFNGR